MNKYEKIRINLNNELNEITNKLNNLQKLKYGNTVEYLRLGVDMCSLLDIQENIMKSYREVLIARIVLLDRNYKVELDNFIVCNECKEFFKGGIKNE